MRTLLTWSDRGVSGPRPTHTVPRSRDDRGPVVRLVAHQGSQYDRARILCTPDGRNGAEQLADALRDAIPAVAVDELAVRDPSDHRQLFEALGPMIADLDHARPCDVLLSAGTPQMQTLWVILVAAGLLPARMLQVIPAAFVPDPHPSPVRVVELDIDGFPEIRAMREELTRLRAQTRGRVGALIGESEVMVRLTRRLRRVAQVDVPALILGETGTGKELVARALHGIGPRADGPFVAENCGSFSEGVLASELFGHERGAFTGAASRRRGLFEQADGGTLFLDEIAETSPRTQVMLLRVLQEGRLRRVGGERELAVDVRVVAATHRDLPAMVASGAFREDLYYRLRGATLELPPLRERGRDLELLVAHFLRELGASQLRPTPIVRAALRRYPWPGNVRELRAEVVRWTVFCDGSAGRVELDDLSPELRARFEPSVEPRSVHAVSLEPQTLRQQVEVVERAAIAEAVDRHEGNLSAAARALDIDRNTLKRKLDRFGMR